MERLRDRVGSWFVYRGNRLAVTGVGLAVAFVLFGPVGEFAVGEDPAILLEQSHFVSLVTTLLSGNFLLLSIVVSVNAVFVSGEQNPLGRQFERVRSTREFRRGIEDVVEFDHVPAEPGAFLRVLTGDLVERAQRLDESLTTADVEFRRDVDAYRESLADAVGELNAAVGADPSPLSVVLAIARFDCDRQVNDLRGLRAGDDVPADAADEIDDLLALLEYLVTAREYFKTLYFRREFANLSTHLVYVGLPAIALGSFAVLHVDGLPTWDWLVVGIYVVSLAPIFLLSAYVVRVAAVSQRTEAAGQFIVYDRERAVRIPEE